MQGLRSGFCGGVLTGCLLVVLLCQSVMAADASVETSKSSPEIPQRVVSMNLCLDQLAIMLAKPGQLKAITHFTQDPAMSMLSEEAMAYPSHTGSAEEIFSMDADLVLTGTYTNRATIDMLEHLNRRVVSIPPAFSLDDIRKNILQVGEVLGQSVKAEKLVSEFDQQFAKIRESAKHKSGESAKRFSAASYGANLYMQGDTTLEREMVEAAGFEHYGTQRKLGYGGRVSLEELVIDPPDVLLLGNYQKDGMHAYAHLEHPVLKKVIPSSQRSGTHPRHWACGTPFVLEAVKQLVQLRKKLEAQHKDKQP
uniref:Cobalamin ABC transporter substrate-binding protein n=1 Tax=uncultured Thiotrichaceae bacterium TaxID=298394 RepID=A0A6S6U8C2_9GAMM|nr:MAG: Cobalamin ABC transporter substrate-binding protein [uncultured Thiotrichaceae bacterium]